MYRYLEPHGLIMKLNNEPLAPFDPAMMARDGQFWDDLSKRLLADPEYLGNEWERRTYSKLRTGIAGLYAFGMWGRTTNKTAMVMQHAAEAAFQQSIALWPTSPEANFRLVQLYIELHRYDDAVAVLDKLETLTPPGPDKPKIHAAITQIREMKQHPPTEPPY
jgi:tetratricopeptide (TPR) repeat protein